MTQSGCEDNPVLNGSLTLYSCSSQLKNRNKVRLFPNHFVHWEFWCVIQISFVAPKSANLYSLTLARKKFELKSAQLAWMAED